MILPLGSFISTHPAGSVGGPWGDVFFTFAVVFGADWWRVVRGFIVMLESLLVLMRLGSFFGPAECSTPTKVLAVDNRDEGLVVLAVLSVRCGSGLRLGGGFLTIEGALATAG
jgi:hypothetical protein